MISFISGKIAEHLYRKNIISKDEAEICKYGYEVLFLNLMNFAIVAVLGALLHTFFCSMVFFVVFALTRNYCGGFHAKSMTICTLTFIAVYLFTIFMATNHISKEFFSFIINAVFCFSYVIAAHAFAPIENENKPLEPYEKKKFKIISIILGVFFSVISISSYNFNSDFAMTISITLLAVTVLAIIEPALKE